MTMGKPICVFLALFFSLATPARSDSSNTIEVKIPGASRKFTLAELKSKLKELTISLNDPVYHATKTFDGFLLADLLKLAGFKDGIVADEIVFTAKDGYSPNTTVAKLKTHRAFLVYREHGKKGFEKVTQGKQQVSPAPYYVVWEEGEKLADSVPWPYQLVKIELVNFREKYDRMYPKDAEADSDEMKGFLVFKNQCVRCHSINLQGGDLGPELNAPQNITEYWKSDVLKRFIRDAGSFRHKSKMPSFLTLKDEEIEQIVSYLERMKDQKLPPK